MALSGVYIQVIFLTVGFGCKLLLLNTLQQYYIDQIIYLASKSHIKETMKIEIIKVMCNKYYLK